MSSFISGRLSFMIIAIGLFFTSERYLSDYDFYPAGLVLSFLFYTLAFIIVLRNLASAKSKGFEKEVRNWQYAMLWKLTVLVSCGFYFAYLAVMGEAKMPGSVVQKTFLALWLVSLVLGLSMGIGVELGIRGSGSAHSADPHRVSQQLKAWLKTGILLCSLIAINYTAVKKDKGFDLSYLKTSLPGESTQSIVELNKKEVQMAAFFKRDSDVGPLVREYLDRIASYNEQVVLNYYDKDFAPVEAEKFRVARNGQIILMTEKNRQRIDLSEDLAAARSKLKKLDERFQKAFLAITAEKKNIYFAQGHGEMSIKSQKNRIRSASHLAKLLRTLNYNVRTLNPAQEGYLEIPDDADTVAIVGASRRYSSREVEALQSYMANGGSLLVFLDVEFGGQKRDFIEDESDPLLEFLALNGFAYFKEKLVNEKKHIRATRKKIDRTFLASNNFSSHIAVKSLAKNEERLAVLTFQSGYLEPSKKIQGKWKIIKTIQSFPSTFADSNNNLEFDDGEKRQAYAIAMAGESEKNKIIVFADATMVSDPLLSNAGNQLTVLDSVKWLIGQEQIIGEISSEEDVKIQHSKSRELFLFHGSIYLVPLLILGIGFIVNKQRKGEIV